MIQENDVPEGMIRLSRDDFYGCLEEKQDESCLDQMCGPLSQIQKRVREEGMREAEPASSLSVSIVQMYKFQGFDEEEELYVMLHQSKLVVGFGTYYWDGPSKPVKAVQTTREKKRTEWEKEDCDSQSQWLLDALVEAKETRLNQFKICQFCGKPTPSEHRFDEHTCHGCASMHYGVVY
ncbi:hypothetical protein [Domibacillus tundrae]|uniref:hypothetical protein n=1 Tax=Domibacillus tundrae TaxID=1587527 RepID=UPI00339760F9